MTKRNTIFLSFDSCLKHSMLVLRRDQLWLSGLWHDRITASSLCSWQWINEVSRLSYFMFCWSVSWGEANTSCVSCRQRGTWALPAGKLCCAWDCLCICKSLYSKDCACWARKAQTWPNPDLNCTCTAPKAARLHCGSALGLMGDCMIANNVRGALESEQTTVPSVAVLCSAASVLLHHF